MNTMLLAGILGKDDPLAVTDALLLALIGIVVVFIVLILLMVIVTLVGKIFDGSEKLRKEHPEWNESVQNLKAKMTFWKKVEEQPATQDEQQPLAKGTCGELKLINCDERDAAMIMAIVADQTQTPLNELRFKSIKRVEEEK